MDLGHLVTANRIAADIDIMCRAVLVFDGHHDLYRAIAVSIAVRVALRKPRHALGTGLCVSCHDRHIRRYAVDFLHHFFPAALIRRSGRSLDLESHRHDAVVRIKTRELAGPDLLDLDALCLRCIRDRQRLFAARRLFVPYDLYFIALKFFTAGQCFLRIVDDLGLCLAAFGILNHLIPGQIRPICLPAVVLV